MYKAYTYDATPFVWGDNVLLRGQYGGPLEITLDVSIISDFQSPFEGEVRYFKSSGPAVTESFSGPPASITFRTQANSIQQPKMRFRSRSVPLRLYIRCTTRAIRSQKPNDIFSGFGSDDLLRRSPSTWGEDDVQSAMGSDAYQRDWDPLHNRVVDAVRRYFRFNYD